ncbi:MAG: glycosyltransferase [Bacteroidales bacterium]|nr:glycosyltransferase [Bacteroidales bacterium]
MKILQLCHKTPLPAIDGGCIAIHNITQCLLDSGMEVKVLAVATPKHPFVVTAYSKDYLKKTRFESVYIDTTPHKIEALRTLFTGNSYQISRFYHKNMVAKLTEVLKNEDFDIIHVESIYMAPYIPLLRRLSRAKILLRLHNIEHLIWERLSENEHNPFEKLAYRVNAHQLKRVERKILREVDGYMSISEPDYQYFHNTAPNVPGVVIPFGINVDDYDMEDDDYIATDRPELFHLGSMNWSPNVEGIEWFLDEVWPEILAAHPDLTFTLAGHDIPERIRNRHDPNVIVVGSVPNANEFMMDYDIMVVPLLSGSGIRIKIVEAMALGRIVITTTIGAEGLDVQDGKHLFIANTPEEFVAIVNKCVAMPDLCTIISENAQHYISMHHNNTVIAQQIKDFYEQVSGK